MIGFIIFFSILLLAGLIVALARLSALSSKARQLEQHIRSLDLRIASLELQVREFLEATPGSRRQSGPSAGPEPARPAEIPVAKQPPRVESRMPLPASAVSARPPVPSAPPPKPSRTREEWEALIGGKLLNRIGALALIIAVGLFLKHAFDNDWITETMRVLIGFVVGSVCLVAASRSARRGFEVFAQGIVGAGLAILYLSVYASFNFYSLVSQPVAFALMSVVTVIAFTQAFKYDALAVSLLGLIGGFLTPFMLSTGEDAMVGLFSYIALLDLGVLIIVAQKDKWMVLEPLALLGTYTVYVSWYIAYFSDEKLLLTLLFLTLFWVLFHGLDLVRIRRGTGSHFDIRRAVGIVHILVFYYAITVLLGSQPDEALAGASLSLGLLYAGSAFLATGQQSQRQFLFGQFIVTGILLSLAAVLIEYEGFTRVIVLAVASLLIGWAGLRGNQKSVWVTGFVFVPFAVLMLLGTPGALAYRPLDSFRLLLNDRALAFAAVAACAGVAGFLYRTLRPWPSRRLEEAFQYGWLAIVIIGVLAETNDLFRTWMVGASDIARDHLGFQRFMTMAGVAGLLVLPVLGYGFGAKKRPLFYESMWVLLAAGCLAGLRGLWYSPIEMYVPLFNLRVAVFLLLVAGFFGVKSMLAKSSAVFEWQDEFRGIASYAPVLLLLILLSTECWDIFDLEKLRLPGGGETSGEFLRLANLQQLTLSGVWLGFSIILMVFGLWRRERGQRFLAIGLFGLAILKIFIYDLSFLETVYRIISFVVLGVILLAVSYLYQRYRYVILGTSPDESTSAGG